MTDFGTLTFSHFSNAATLEPRNATQFERFAWDKPKGLWLSVDGDDDWPAWCAQTGIRDIARQHRFHVELADDADVLWLRGFHDLLTFTERFARPITEMITGVAWDDVASEYAGIVITPYCWPARLEMRTLWYYGWDCASGCIWDATAIKAVSPVPQTTTTPEGITS